MCLNHLIFQHLFRVWIPGLEIKRISVVCLISMGASETIEKPCVSYRKHASLAPKIYKCTFLCCFLSWKESWPLVARWCSSQCLHWRSHWRLMSLALLAISCCAWLVTSSASFSFCLLEFFRKKQQLMWNISLGEGQVPPLEYPRKICGYVCNGEEQIPCRMVLGERFLVSFPHVM